MSNDLIVVTHTKTLLLKAVTQTHSLLLKAVTHTGMLSLMPFISTYFVRSSVCVNVSVRVVYHMYAIKE